MNCNLPNPNTPRTPHLTKLRYLKQSAPKLIQGFNPKNFQLKPQPKAGPPLVIVAANNNGQKGLRHHRPQLLGHHLRRNFFRDPIFPGRTLRLFSSFVTLFVILKRDLPLIMFILLIFAHLCWSFCVWPRWLKIEMPNKMQNGSTNNFERAIPILVASWNERLYWLDVRVLRSDSHKKKTRSSTLIAFRFKFTTPSTLPEYYI